MFNQVYEDESKNEIEYSKLKHETIYATPNLNDTAIYDSVAKMPIYEPIYSQARTKSISTKESIYITNDNPIYESTNPTYALAENIYQGRIILSEAQRSTELIKQLRSYIKTSNNVYIGEFLQNGEYYDVIFNLWTDYFKDCKIIMHRGILRFKNTETMKSFRIKITDKPEKSEEINNRIDDFINYIKDTNQIELKNFDERKLHLCFVCKELPNKKIYIRDKKVNFTVIT